MKLKFIVVEGADCVGKSTFTKMLQTHCEKIGLDVFTVHPLYDHDAGNLAYQAMCRREPIDDVRQLMIVAHGDCNENLVRPKLDAGKVVIQDRNWLSTINFQWVNHGADPDKDLELIYNVHRCYDKHAPFVVLLDGPDDIIDARLATKQNKDANELEGVEFHRKIRKQYRDLMEVWKSWGYEGMVLDSSNLESFEAFINSLEG